MAALLLHLFTPSGFPILPIGYHLEVDHSNPSSYLPPEHLEELRKYLIKLGDSPTAGRFHGNNVLLQSLDKGHYAFTSLEGEVLWIPDTAKGVVTEESIQHSHAMVVNQLDQFQEFAYFKQTKDVCDNCYEEDDYPEDDYPEEDDPDNWWGDIGESREGPSESVVDEPPVDTSTDLSSLKQCRALIEDFSATADIVADIVQHAEQKQHLESELLRCEVTLAALGRELTAKLTEGGDTSAGYYLEQVKQAVEEVTRYCLSFEEAEKSKARQSFITDV